MPGPRVLLGAFTIAAALLGVTALLAAAFLLFALPGLLVLLGLTLLSLVGWNVVRVVALEGWYGTVYGEPPEQPKPKP